MRNLLSIIALLIVQLSFSQSKFEKMPEGAKEIQFSYKLSSKIYFDESGVYGDSLFFKRNFPKRNSIRITNPKESYLNCKMNWNTFRNADKKQLLAFLYHNNESYTGLHFIEQNKTVIFAVRNDEKIKEIFKKYFDEDYIPFNYKIEMNYHRRVKHINYPSVYYQFGFDEIEKGIEYISKTQGFYSEVVKRKSYSNQVNFDENLSKYITMGYVFKNNDFGVSKIESSESILELTEVKYK